MVDITDPITNVTISFHVDLRLQKFLNQSVIDRIQKKDKDYVMIIDGYEGSGKSTLAQQMGKFVDPTLNLSRICMTTEEFKQAIVNSKKNQCVIYDEAVTGMTAGDTISRIGKLLKSMMMQMRQKNLFVIVIIPTVFELNKYSVLSRARTLFHTYEKKDRMGYWVGYNKKDMRKLYLLGKKTYSYKVRSRFIGRFYGKYAVDEEEYRNKKEKALWLIESSYENKEKRDKYIMQRDLIIKFMYNLVKTYKIKEFNSLRKLSKAFKIAGMPLSDVQLGKIMNRKGEDMENSENNVENMEEVQSTNLNN